MADNVESEKTKNGAFDIRDAIKGTVLKMGPNFSVEEKKDHAKVLIKVFEKEMSAKQAMNISDEEISIIYSYAYQLFNGGKYADACELFKMLTVLDPQEGGFISGLAACYHKLQDYETALMFYLMHAELNPKDPVPTFYSYDCLMRLKNFEGAYMMLRTVIQRANHEPQYEQLQAKAEALLRGFDVSTLTELADAIKAAESED